VGLSKSLDVIANLTKVITCFPMMTSFCREKSKILYVFVQFNEIILFLQGIFGHVNEKT